MTTPLLEPVFEAAREALAGANEALELEQAPRGLEAWSELQLRDAVAERLRSAHEVETEARYPHAVTRRAWRCDLVVGGPADDALWIEVKRLEQARSWRRQLGVSVSEDAARLASDAALPHRALLLFAFVSDPEGAREAVDAWRRELGGQGIEVLPGLEAELGITDRTGMSTLFIALLPVLPRERRLGPVVLRR